jgi:DNA-3-methyladenine glycosylase
MNVDDLLGVLREDVVEAARALVGATLVKGDMRALIVETEAYRHDDPACHAFGRQRMKNMALWGEPGNSYVYFTYGNHWMFNVVAHERGDAAAVLIRAAQPLAGIEAMLARRPTTPENLLSGPGKLAQAFGIDSALNDLCVVTTAVDAPIRIEPRSGQDPKIAAGPRIGIAEGKWHEVPWRFIDVDRLNWISRPLPPQFRRQNKRNKV